LSQHYAVQTPNLKSIQYFKSSSYEHLPWLAYSNAGRFGVVTIPFGILLNQLGLSFSSFQ